jgi:hypothetical protein
LTAHSKVSKWQTQLLAIIWETDGFRKRQFEKPASQCKVANNKGERFRWLTLRSALNRCVAVR